MEQHYYILSGLGADHRIFEKLTFPSNSTHLPWIPNQPKEELRSYATRMAEGIKHKNPVLIGLSFGGVISQEIAKIIPVKKIILISTVKARNEKPFYINWSGWINLPAVLPTYFIQKTNAFTYWIFGAEEDDIKLLLDDYLSQTDPNHIRWAMIHIARWKNVEGNECPVFHIHSSGDRVLPTWRVKKDVVVSGGHLCVHTNPEYVQMALDQVLV